MAISILLFSSSVMSVSFATPWTVARQAPLSMEFPRQEYWSGLPFPSPGDLPRPRDWIHVSCIEGEFFTTEPPGKHVIKKKKKEKEEREGWREGGMKEGRKGAPHHMSSENYKSEQQWDTVNGQNPDHCKHQKLARMWSNRNSCPLPVGMQNGPAILEDLLVVSYKTKTYSAYSPAIGVLPVYTKELNTYRHEICT